MKTNDGQDFQSRAIGGNSSLGVTGTSTGVAATTLTDSGKSWTTNEHRGKVVFTGSVYGVVLSNTGTVLTIDKWYTPGSPGGAAASTPSTGVYVLGLAMQPASWIGITTDSASPAAGDTSLASELTASGLQRALASWGHTSGVASYTLTNTFTSADATTRTIAKMGVFNVSAPGTGQFMLFETLVTPNAILATGDQMTITETVSM